MNIVHLLTFINYINMFINGVIVCFKMQMYKQLLLAFVNKLRILVLNKKQAVFHY